MKARVIFSTLVGNKVVLKNGFALVIEDGDKDWVVFHTNSMDVAYKVKEYADAYIRSGAELDEVISAMRSKAIAEGTGGDYTELPAGVWYSLDGGDIDIAKFYAAKERERLTERIVDAIHSVFPEEGEEREREAARKIVALLEREGIL